MGDLEKLKNMQQSTQGETNKQNHKNNKQTDVNTFILLRGLEINCTVQSPASKSLSTCPIQQAPVHNKS